MHSKLLFLSLFWRTLTAQFIFGLVLLIIGTLISLIGIQFPSQELAVSVTFIKLKPSLFYAIFALLLLSVEFWLNINIIRVFLGKKLNLSQSNWREYVVSLSVLLLALAALNILVAIFASVDTWLAYKLFGVLGLQLLGIYIIIFRLKHSE